MNSQARRIRSAAGAVLLALVLTLLGANLGTAQSEKVTKQDVEQWMKELSNWGRWGSTDELGAINLITAEKRRQAAALVRAGVSVSLARDVEKEKAADNPQPFVHEMTRSGLDETQFSIDRYSVSYHGYAHTHMDSLCHMFHEGKMFNGYAQQQVTPQGAGKLAVLNFKHGIFTRGILMDIARLKGVEYLEPGTPIYPADLEAWEKQAGVKVSSGDVIFIRTGRWALRNAKGPWPASQKSAGLHASCARWLKQRDVAALGSDAASDVMPSGVEGVNQPIHQLVLIALGMPIFDNCDLEALSAETARQGRWEFLLTAAPLAVGGGTGSPLNPIATF